jgi:site-specific recombinase XerD
MGNAKFYLKNPQSEKSPIICLLSHSGKRTKIYTGITIAVKQWNAEEQKAKTRGYLNGGQINDALQAIAAKLDEFILDCRAKGYIPSDNDLRAIVEPEQAEDKSLTFWQAWEEYVTIKSESEAMKLKLSAIKKRLKNFEGKNQPFTFENLNVALMEKIEGYFIKAEKLQNSTVAKHISFFKSFLHWAVKREITENTKWQQFTVTNPPDKLKVVLSTSELALIKAFDHKEKKYLLNVRDLFLIGCYTGLRFSDFTRISRQHLKEDGDGYVLRIRQQKTDDLVEIPLTEESLTLCRRLIEGEIRIITNQKMNDYLKELCQLSGIDEPFEVDEFRGKMKISKTVPKWQLIGTHTARRTFATNLLIQGIPAEVVMQYTGHKDYKSFSKYVNVPKNSQHNFIRKAIINYAG